MAVTLASALYPPQFPSTMAPAFSQNSTLRVYFSISSFNSSASIKRCHVSITNQSSGENVVDTPTGLLILNYSYDSKEGLYYVEIPAGNIKGAVTKSTALGETELVESGWQVNQYYKFQMRFDGNEESSYSNSESYFNSYSQYFSEWSQVLLLRPISQPTLRLLPFDKTTIEDGTSVTQTLNPGILHLNGVVTFENLSEKETVKSYSVKIVNGLTQEIIKDKIVEGYTGDSINPNVIDCRINLAAISGIINTSKCLLVVTVTTKNNYVFSSTRAFAIGEYTTEDNFDPTVMIDTSSVDNGIVKIHITNADVLNGGTVYITRSSNLSNFQEWETIEEIPALGALDKVVIDTTVGSGVFYRYAAQMENTVGGMTKIYNAFYYEEEDGLQQKIYTVFPDFYDAILSRDGKQISIRYNYKISSFKPTVSRSKMDVLGGRYPKFVENAAMNYKQLSITGLISTQEDEEGLFLTKEEFYKDMLTNYRTYEEEEYRDAYNIENYNYFWEREFREELVKWLNDGEPKLYRSMTEGTLVVMVTDISLTPNSTLSRRLYDFSATMYEIADGSSLDTLDELGIFNRKLIGTAQTTDGDDDDTKTYVSISIPGQLYRVLPPKNVSGISDQGEVVSGLINSELQKKYGGVYSQKTYNNLYISDVKIQFLSNPSLYLLDNENVTYITQSEMDRIQNLSNPTEKANLIQKVRLGYRFEIETDGESDSAVFFVGEKGYYQIPNNIIVRKLRFTNPNDLVSLDYVTHYNQTDDSSSQVISTSIEKVVIGQYRDTFGYEEFLGDKIKRRYSYVTDEYTQSMQWFKGICADVDPYSWIEVKYNGDESYNTFLAGETGVLHFIQNFAIDSLAFRGRYMKRVPIERAGFAESWEFTLPEKDVVYKSTDDIKSPVWQMVYNIGGTYYIYYVDGHFYQIDLEVDRNDGNKIKAGTARVPVQGDVNYYGNVVKMTLG